MYDEAIAVGQIRVMNAVKMEIVSIKRRGLFRSLAVQVRWTVLNQEPEYKWVYPGETLLTNIDVDVRPPV